MCYELTTNIFPACCRLKIYNKRIYMFLIGLQIRFYPSLSPFFTDLLYVTISGRSFICCLLPYEDCPRTDILCEQLPGHLRVISSRTKLIGYHPLFILKWKVRPRSHPLCICAMTSKSSLKTVGLYKHFYFGLNNE